MGGTDVCGRNGDTLAADELEKAVPVMVQCHAFVVDGDRGVRGTGGDLPICNG